MDGWMGGWMDGWMGGENYILGQQTFSTSKAFTNSRPRTKIDGIAKGRLHLGWYGSTSIGYPNERKINCEWFHKNPTKKKL